MIIIIIFMLAIAIKFTVKIIIKLNFIIKLPLVSNYCYLHLTLYRLIYLEFYLN